ncbi:MAG: RMD1 family protein [Alphaproteobacteria bacterium]|nr:RMD1 family protein [Alphaproteobacteria bacterium]MBL6938788.1 RMD1 family protein [Alphaproteobacteria bacterium]MBL7097855.1 RMD1 family protein [Alphaproteobacteria bacterium]
MPPEASATPLRARAVLLGDRLNIDRALYEQVVSATPFALRIGQGFAVAFRYGAAVLVGLTPEEEAAALARLSTDLANPISPQDEERVAIALLAEGDEGPQPDGILCLRTLDLPRVLVIADILAKSVALARYEREIAQVFDTIEPAAQAMSETGRIPRARGPLLRLIGSALLAQHRFVGRIAVAEKPDVLWDQPSLERLYARLEDEYEIVERGTLLNGKLTVIGTVAETFTDMIDTARSTRLEILIVVLILAELVIAAVQLFH